ncbi:MAG TPA: hypothetical protein VE129_01330 [Thermoanaerobaculia bacterium]|nr:hypothetical protein [Thermoanaerobaculia bacterium]
MTPEIAAGIARLKEEVRGIPPERLALVLEKAKRININVTPQEHEEIHATAERLGLSVTDYLLRLHEAVSERLLEESLEK